MKRFSKLIYFLILALFILSLSGCGSHTPRQYGNSSTNTNNGTNDNSGGTDNGTEENGDN